MRLAQETRRRWWIGSVVAACALGAASLIAFRIAVGALKGEIAAALGPTSEIRTLQVGWSGVVIEGLRIPAAKGWPVADALRAERVVVVPSLRSLVSGHPYRIRSVTVTRPYLSAYRSRDGIRSALPGVDGESGPAGVVPAAAPSVVLGEIVVEAGVVEIFDATVQKPPLRIRLEQIEARIEDVTAPGLLGRSSFEINGVVKGGTRDGAAQVEGWAELATRNSSIRMQLHDVDLVPLAPYLVQNGEAGVRSGRVDLDLHSEVKDARIRAPGKLTLTGLELDPDSGMLPTFMGMSRRAVLASLKEKGDRITVDFTIEGNLDNPAFSLNGALSKQLALSLANSLGVGLVGLAEGVGTLGLKGTEAAGDAVKGVGSALWDLVEPKRDK